MTLATTQFAIAAWATSAVALIIVATAMIAIEYLRRATPRPMGAQENAGSPLASRLGWNVQGRWGERPFIAVLIAAHNEEASIAATLASLLSQQRRADRIVVAADNCSDRTATRARAFPVTVFETERNRAKKPGALNQAWREYCIDADLVVCIDADTVLDPNALADWQAEFLSDRNLGGCSAKFTMRVTDDMSWYQKLLVRIQRAEFAKWTDLALKRGRRTNVLAGTACCIRNDTLREIAAWRMTNHTTAIPTPWLETSVVEDFELTYRMRQLGWRTTVSATVRAYTDAMTDLRSLWAQRMKWQVGTVSDLLEFGYNDLTRFDWWQQAQGLVAVTVRFLWVALVVAGAMFGRLELRPLWLLPPVLFLLNDVRQSFRIPHCQPADVVVAALLLPQECFAVMRAGWFVASWTEVVAARLRASVGPAFRLPPPKSRDRWSLQFRAEHGR
jgi:cellulose synthase/poly-beta-1,6-N-acetylglucosamine synthase-like glycosyltransferase